MKDPPSATTKYEEVRTTHFTLQLIVQSVFTFFFISKRSVSNSANDAMSRDSEEDFFGRAALAVTGEAGAKDVSPTWIAVDRTCELLEGELAIMMADKEGAELAPPISTALLLL